MWKWRTFVTNSVSITATEAIDYKVIDLIANDHKELLQKVHAKSVTLANGKQVILNTDQTTLDEYLPTLKQKILAILSNPNLFYLLFMAGIIGLGFEMTHRGGSSPRSCWCYLHVAGLDINFCFAN